MVDFINNGKTRAEELLEQKKGLPPEITNRMARGVSDQRREMLEIQLEQGQFREQGSGLYSRAQDGGAMKQTSAGFVTHSGKNFVKLAAPDSGGSATSSASGWRGSNDTSRQVPEVYSPLWLNSNLNLPRDRATINAWSRSFFALNPIVHNSVSLHSTYPIAKLNIKCKNSKVEKFFSQMMDEIDLMNMCVLIAQEYWVLGEAFVYAELNESKGTWSRLMILNPDYVNVQRSVIAAEPQISLRPDENLRRVVFGNKPSDILQRKQLDPSIVEHVRRNENIPLNNFYVSHIARKISPYEIRGTGLIVSCFRALMLWDKFRECYSEDTEVLTNKGFKTIHECVTRTEGGELRLPEDLEIGCFNPDNGALEFHKPTEAVLKNYQGKMIHFTGKNVDSLVTPGHEMWVARRTDGNEYGAFEKIEAQDLQKQKPYKMVATVDWVGSDVESKDVCGYEVPIDVYLKFLGHTISEGCVDTSVVKSTGYSRGRIIISQLTASDAQSDMQKSMRDFGAAVGIKIAEEIKIRGSGFSKNTPKEAWIGTLSNKKIVNAIKEEIGIDGKCDSHHKRVPRWVMNLPKTRLLKLLSTLVAGDGSEKEIQAGVSYRYSTVCKELADDVQELAFKCGYSAFISVGKRPTCTEYVVRWSDSVIGKNPIIHDYGSGASIKEIDYDGLVWCFTVPTGLLVTRRNNRTTVASNCKYAQADNMVNPLTLVKIGSAEFKPTPVDLDHWRNIFADAQYDKDFKIFTHNDVTVERVGYNSGIVDTATDIDNLKKEIYIGLMVPSVIMDGSDTTYATGSVALDVLRQRYMQFRNYMASWLKHHIFAPIAEINDFYEYVDGEKTLIVPEIDWNHMSLFDMSDYINNLVQLSQGEGAQKRVSLQTLYRSIGLEYEEEQRKIRFEDIQDAIRMREIQSMARYSLHELRSLGPQDEVEEVTEEPVPGQSPYIAGGGGAPPGGGGGAPPPMGGPPPGGPPPGGPPPGGPPPGP